MTPELLRRVGDMLYGAGWQRALARGLGPLHPKKARESIDDRLVRRWASGERPIPGWVATAAIGMLDSAEAEISAVRAEIAAAEQARIDDPHDRVP